MALFPAPRRLVTGHDEKGKAVYLKDHTIEPEATNMDASFAVLWETHEFPANNNGFKDPIETKTESLSNKDGVVLRVVDIPANTVTVIAQSLFFFNPPFFILSASDANSKLTPTHSLSTGQSLWTSESSWRAKSNGNVELLAYLFPSLRILTGMVGKATSMMA